MEASRVRRPLRLLSRQERSFEQLYKRHARDVYQYALAVLSNPADAEDVTQTTFLNAYRAFQKGERPQKPHNWLIAIAHNVCRMRWRQAGSRPKEVALGEAPEPVALDQDRPDLDDVLGALAQLSFNQRAAIVMRELEGRSYQEISEVLGVSVSAVEALLFRARRRLQVKRKALGVLTTVPLPGSLAGLFGGGGGAVAIGGAALGADIALKAAAVVAVGTAVAGAGFTTVHAVAAREAVAPAQHNSRAPTHHVAAHGKPTLKLRRAVRTTASGQVSRPTAAAGSSAVSTQQAAVPLPSPTATVAATATPRIAVKTPAVVVRTPPLPVPVPKLPPVAPVTVTVSPLPPLLP